MNLSEQLEQLRTEYNHAERRRKTAMYREDFFRADEHLNDMETIQDKIKMIERSIDSDYYRGQMNLIRDIKEKVSKLEETTTITDLAFDIILLLKTIKPVDK